MRPRLVVVGDSLLDVDITGAVSRVCPDAPVPVVDVAGETDRAGGAALAATLAAADGASVRLVTAIADDADGDRLRAALAGVDVVAGAAASTPVKARVRCAGQSLLRLDRGGDGPPARATDEMLDAVRDADAVLVSDYGRGLAACERLRAVLAEVDVPVVWDPHPRGPEPVPGITLATPNLAEATAFAGTGDPEAARLLRDRWRAGAVAVTTGARGALLDRGNGVEPVPAAAVDAADTCGAGDRFAAAAADALMRGADTYAAVEAAVAAASRFLAEGGLSASRPEPTPEALIAAVRARGGTVVATGGCFDLVHAGHARTLAAARALGDCLIVCLNSDESVRRLKGPRRPIMGEADRAALLRALACVDAVVVFGEDDPRRVLARLRPDIWVKGGDYDPDDLPEADLVRGWGGRVVTTPLLPGRSTTRLAGALAEAG
ncbi:PfkB family carbohydrate kinase [Actinokineospora sp. UTMC 2448]|uniref:PfkB family carbohydrate kinase n=1 Tax=Actinokineospora sp. UTMC 2448 TaxID=2268449 RepID=UPI00216476A8|nr:PfkB family carbohydrate kinase [Actinokineospora sp. UTMC 2448]UVS79796.1 Bifunctional protein HldE [Actinokineospora sp. UTMC 2448]